MIFLEFTQIFIRRIPVADVQQRKFEEIYKMTKLNLNRTSLYMYAIVYIGFMFKRDAEVTAIITCANI